MKLAGMPYYYSLEHVLLRLGQDVKVPVRHGSLLTPSSTSTFREIPEREAEEPQRPRNGGLVHNDRDLKVPSLSDRYLRRGHTSLY